MLVFIPILLVISVAVFLSAWFVFGCYREIERVGWLIKLERLEVEIAGCEERAAMVRKEMALWKDFEPAMDAQRYPIVQLSNITGTMPSRGIVLKKFSTNKDGITLKGDASRMEPITQWLDALKEHPKLAYDWSMPEPQASTSTLSFEIHGSLKQ